MLDVVSSFKEESSFQTAQTPHPNTVSYNTSSGELFRRIDVSTRAITSRSDTGSGANSRIPTHGREDHNYQRLPRLVAITPHSPGSRTTNLTPRFSSSPSHFHPPSPLPTALHNQPTP